LNSLFAQRKNIFSPNFYKFLAGIKKFCVAGQRKLQNPSEETLAEFLMNEKISSDTIKFYIEPMVAAIWSAPQKDVFQFPAQSLLKFFKNHGLLSLKNRPNWQTIVGGSSQYIKAFQNQFPGTVLTNCPVDKVIRNQNKGLVQTKNETMDFDEVIIGLHAPDVLKILENPSAEELEVFKPWRYQKNRVCLHTDISFLPKNTNAWASWNVVREKTLPDYAAVPVTYWMNLLQNLKSHYQYCVTLNPTREIPAIHQIKEVEFEHPMFDSSSVASQEKIKTISGNDRIYYAGAYLGYGFHEDGFHSAYEISKKIGGKSYE